MKTMLYCIFLLVDGTANCTLHPHDPVCDLDNREHANSCWLAHHNAKLAYRGPCLRNCRHTGEVCGINGKTYISECAAWADFVSIDYKGRCMAVGLITDGMGQQCDNIQCLTLSDEDCLGMLYFISKANTHTRYCTDIDESLE